MLEAPMSEKVLKPELVDRVTGIIARGVAGMDLTHEEPKDREAFKWIAREILVELFIESVGMEKGK